LDHASKLHVLCQTGASAFTHSVISTDGKLLQQEIYDYVKARPRLSEDSDGNIIIQGGVRRVEPDTIPQVKSPDQLAR
jgi:hypothetical protein